MAEIKKVEYFYVMVEDRPGEGGKLLDILKDKGVNLVAFTAFPSGEGRSQLDLFPENAKQLQGAANEAGIALVGPKSAFLIQGDDEVGALADIHRKLSSADINIHAANGVTNGQGGYGFILWVKPEDYDKAAQALGA